jgi:hypothetical protein
MGAHPSVRGDPPSPGPSYRESVVRVGLRSAVGVAAVDKGPVAWAESVSSECCRFGLMAV